MTVKDLWAITVALPHETKGFLPGMKVQAQTHFEKVKILEVQWNDQNCILIETGMGPIKAEKAVRFVVQNYPMTHLISTGYCGALVPGIKNGDAILAADLLGPGEGEAILHSDPGLVESIRDKLLHQKVSFHLGTLLTSDRPILDSEDKKKLGAETGAIAVDMESYSVLKAAQETKKIASLAIRFVLDAQEDDWSSTETFMDPEKGFRPPALVREVFRKPKVLLELPGFERQSHRARKTMVRVIENIVK